MQGKRVFRPLCVLLVLAGACGGRAGYGGSGSPSSTGSSSGVPCSGVDQDGGSCARVEAGAVTGDARVPLNHRATGARCPSQRGPGVGAGGCSDSECDGGINGRCIYVGLSLGCTYDECFTDSDCPPGPGGPCICRLSPSEPNSCASGNCVVDSSCGSGNYCSLSFTACAFVTYFCHTPSDTCIDDTDCADFDAGDQSAPPTGGICAYDSHVAHWVCRSRPFCNLP
jgi:hypothetical protein